ncbi:MAG: hypothetical protein Q8868_04420 [Bacteroidota bacterium]|nr:hypothetical protein [Bacteroidota bacterium]
MSILKTQADTRNINLLSRKTALKLLFLVCCAAVLILVIFIFLGFNRASRNLSFIPDPNEINFTKLKPAEVSIIKENKWYKIIVDKQGDLNVTTPEGALIMSGLTYYAEHGDKNEYAGLDSISVSLTSDSTISITGNCKHDSYVRLILAVSKNHPYINVNVNTSYKKETTVRREALIASFDVPVTEVYLKNRKIDPGPFEPEYWLGREGARFGEESRSALIYHTPDVSSLQLNPGRKLLYVNLAYSRDHPFVRIPYQEDGGGRSIDLSAARYKTGDIRDNDFTIWFGRIPAVIPRIMMVPDGYLAGYVFTEHADGGNLRRNRAVYFGSEEITDIKNATGGFAGHKIPVTKSVFYIDSQDCSVRDNPEFLDFLDQLYSTGIYEICLHTPGDPNPNHELLDESMKFMNERYNSSTWIDHGVYNGKYNRECFVCDGLDPNSRYYTRDLWQKYGIHYFWNFGLEKIYDEPLKTKIKEFKLTEASAEYWRRYLSSKELKHTSFFSAFYELIKRPSSKYELNLLCPFRGELCPTPVYWQNPTQSYQFYSWGTAYEKDFTSLTTKKVDKVLETEKQNLDKLLNDWGVFINHGYFVRSNGHENGIWTDLEGKIKINPYFDRILDYMSNLRDEGNLYITTIRDLMNYWIKTENVNYEYRPDGTIYLYNNNAEAINGLSLAVHAGSVRVNDEIPQFKRVGGETIFWFDIPSRARAKILIQP